LAYAEADIEELEPAEVARHKEAMKLLN